MALTTLQTSLFLAIIHIISSFTLKLFGDRVTNSWLRLFVASPLLVLNVYTPLFYDRSFVITRILTFFCTAWLSSFKILQWIIHRGPLSDQRLTTLQWTLVESIPITPVDATARGRMAEDVSGAALARKWVAKIAFLGGIVQLLQRKDLPPAFESFLYGLALYALLSLAMDGPGAIASSFVNLSVSPHFDSPWFAKSVAAFWNKNWDLSAGNALRLLVYEPIIEGRLVKKDEPTPTHHHASLLRTLIGATASFCTSGLVHEGAMLYLTGRTSPSFTVLSFFLVQVPAIAVEKVVLGFLRRRGIQVPRILLNMWVLGFEVWASHTLFWKPMRDLGVIQSALDSLKGSYIAFLTNANDFRRYLASQRTTSF